jgi:hypothetical protein
MEGGNSGSTQIQGLPFSSEEEDQMFGKGKGSSHDKDEQLPPAPQLQDSIRFSAPRRR